MKLFFGKSGNMSSKKLRRMLHPRKSLLGGLVEIAETRFPLYFNTEEKLLLMSSQVHLHRELTCEAVLQRLESLEEEIISKGVKLVIVDSIASVVRKEFDAQLQGNIKERNKFLAKEASLLKYLAEEFSLP
ncbi:hypothetical protein A6R68_09047, partial [Neotoma lepida]